ncbi:group I truncated hemoglobin [Cohnella caldifontis]|uniref:group I truncated hemoglobin n=1 Tax=Cohnella caldifontis TaxID=3027471 RepID=UPI0023EAA313|nr:group 1 truncated hemoglobin [Cohnella sp. YIM B05605]
MTATKENLFEKLGGEEAIAKVVDKFYDKVMADGTVNGFFARTDMEKQRRHQADFIGYALGSGKKYTGQSMSKVHAGMNLQPKHYDAIVNHLSSTLREFGTSPEDIRKVEDTVNTLRDDILYK